MLSKADVDQIEQALDVSLPKVYRTALFGARPDHVDQTSMLDNAEHIIGWTIDYRSGFSGLPKWPVEYVYIGDEADACPYVIHCKTGEVLKLDKGNVERMPLESFLSLSTFFDNFVYDDADD